MGSCGAAILTFIFTPAVIIYNNKPKSCNVTVSQNVDTFRKHIHTFIKVIMFFYTIYDLQVFSFSKMCLQFI